jgi:hypothetical protein
MTTEDLCKILHYALAREMRAHGVNDLDLDNGVTWDESPDGYKLALRGAVTSMELVTRKDERDAYRREITDCLDDLARNPRGRD